MEQITNWIVDKQPIIIQGFIGVLIAIIAVWIGFKLANVIASAIKKLMHKRGIDIAVASFISNLLQIFLKLAVIIGALTHVGFETSSFIAILGAAGLAIGLSLQGSLANFASGLLIIAFRPFKAGDFVEISGVSGSVRDVQIFSTILTTLDNRHVVVPNAQVTSVPIVNYTRHKTRRIDMCIGVSYGADLKHAEQVLKSVLDDHDLVLKDPAYTVGVLSLGDSSVNFAVRPWVETNNYWPVQFDLNKKIKMALDAEGISIPFPQMDVHLHQDQS